MTGGRLHHDIRHSSPPLSFVTPLPLVLSRSLFLSVSLSCRSAPSRPPPLFLALSVTLPFEVSVLLPTAGAEAVTTIIVSEVTSLKHREEEKEHEGDGGAVGAEREREEEKGPTGLFIEPATNIEQLVSIRPVIATFTQPLSYPIAKWRCGRANHEYPLLSGYCGSTKSEL